MCYNSDCRIEIKSVIDGAKATVSANGKVAKTPSGMRFYYVMGGDECTLTVTDGEVVQSRQGEQNVKMTFRKNEQTECYLESGGFAGTFPVFTHDLRACAVAGNSEALKAFTLSIVYTIGEQKIELDFSAEYK